MFSICEEQFNPPPYLNIFHRNQLQDNPDKACVCTHNAMSCYDPDKCRYCMYASLEFKLSHLSLVDSVGLLDARPDFKPQVRHRNENRKKKYLFINIS